MEINDRAISYDDIQYVSLPFIASHPSTLAVTAAFAGLITPPVEKCRILEIGCAGGGNILPMAAAFSGSSFVGVDACGPHIDEARAMAAAAGLSNVEFHCADICEFNPGGQFDYILAHGFYSWVPARVRDRLLKICSDYLTPNGAAFISYMVYPGAYVYQALRHAILLAARQTPPENVPATARKAANILAEISPRLAPRWGPVLAKWTKDMTASPDYSILHDQLSPDYHPVYFSEFVDHAASNGIRYLSDIAREEWATFAAGMGKRIENLAPGPIVPLQFMDIASFRMFRQSVLARADAPSGDPVPLAVIDRAYFASDKALPPQPGAPNTLTTAVDISKLDPQSRGVLDVLARRWPKTWNLSSLAREMREQTSGPQNRALAQTVLKLFELRFVEIWMTEPVHIGDGSDPAKAQTTTLARAQAAAGKSVTNLRHLSFHGDDPEARRIIAMADGREPAEISPSHFARLAQQHVAGVNYRFDVVLSF